MPNRVWNSYAPNMSRLEARGFERRFGAVDASAPDREAHQALAQEGGVQPGLDHRQQGAQLLRLAQPARVDVRSTTLAIITTGSRSATCVRLYSCPSRATATASHTGRPASARRVVDVVAHHRAGEPARLGTRLREQRAAAPPPWLFGRSH